MKFILPVLFTLLTVALITSPQLQAEISNPHPAKRGSIAVYLMAGQSNMRGVAQAKPGYNPDFLTRYLDENGQIPAIQIYAGCIGVDPKLKHHLSPLQIITNNGNKANSLFGPEIGFGERLAALRPSQPIALLKHSVSGHSLERHFHPGKNATDKANWGPSFTAMVDTFNKGLKALEADGWQPVIHGICWQQGEQDAKDGLNVPESDSSADNYGKNLRHFIHRVREQYELYAAPEGIRFVLGQVLPYAPPGGDVAARFPGRDLVRRAILNADENSGHPFAVENTFAIPTNHIDYPTLANSVPNSYRPKDEVHLNEHAQIRLGQEMAHRMLGINKPITATSKQVDSSSATTPPNILVVLVDDMGTEDSSVDFNYSSDGKKLGRVNPTRLGLPRFSADKRHYRTPHMEALAANGMKFSRAYACNVCSPSRVSLLTGQNSARHGTIQYIGGGGKLHNIKAPPNIGLRHYHRTLAEVMRDAGYRSIISGKGHIGNRFNKSINNYKNPAAPADDYYGFQVNVSASTNGQQGSNYANAKPAFRLPNSGPPAHLIAEYQDKTYHDIDPVKYPTDHPHAAEPVFITEAITREMNERIEDAVKAGKPFLAYMSHFAVHDPHTVDPRFAANYPNLSGDVLAFATMVEGVDKSLGDIMAKLQALGVAENTLVIFLGDNGSDAKPRGKHNPATLTMSNPLRGEKSMRYEGGIRIPLIVSWAKPNASHPNQQLLDIPAASRTHDIVAIQDLFPTILTICGIPVPAKNDKGDPLVLDGTDLTPYLKNLPGTHRPQKLISHVPSVGRSAFFTTYHEGDWKLIYNYTTSSPDTSKVLPLGSYELYNLAKDPHEAKNLAKSKPKRVIAMARAMIAELEKMDAPYPLLRGHDAALEAVGLPHDANDPHPVILR